ncbi:MAG: hypothetical protein U1F52_05365 [Burkholderiales bacterium]
MFALVYLGVKFLDWLFSPSKPRPSALAAPVPVPAPDLARNARDSNQSVQEQRLSSLLAPVENPWARSAGRGRADCLPTNPWASASASTPAVASPDNPWASADSAPANEGRCQALWADVSQRLQELEFLQKQAWLSCDSRYEHGPKWNACAEAEIEPIQAQYREMAARRSEEANACRGWVARNQYADIEGRVKAAKTLYDRAVGTNPVVRKIQNEALKEVGRNNADTLRNVGEVTRGMDEVAGSPCMAER